MPRPRRLVPGVALALAAVVPAVPAAAAPGFHAGGIVRSVDGARGLITVQDTDGDKALRGHVLTIHVTSATKISRDGNRVRLSAVHPGDGLDANGGVRSGRLIASQVQAVSPPRPDGPPVAIPGTCVYYGPCTPTAPPASAGKSLSLTISNFTFNPPIAVISPGTVVTVHNADPVAHTFSGNHLDSGGLSTGASYNVEFTTAGTYRFFCSIHPFMTGLLDVVSH